MCVCAVTAGLLASSCHAGRSSPKAQQSAAPTTAATRSEAVRCPASEPLPERPDLTWKATSTLICVYAAAGHRPPGMTLVAGDPLSAAFASLRPWGSRGCDAYFDSRNASVIRSGPGGETNIIDFNLSGCMPVTTPAHKRLVVAYRFDPLLSHLAAQAWKHPQRA